MWIEQVTWGIQIFKAIITLHITQCSVLKTSAPKFGLNTCAADEMPEIDRTQFLFLTAPFPQLLLPP